MSRSPLPEERAILPGLERLLVATARMQVAAEAGAAEANLPPAEAGAGGGRRFRARVRPHSRLLVVVLVLSLTLLAAAGAAAVLLITEGSPLPAPRAVDLGPWEHPVPGSVTLAGLNVPDPEGGAPWDMRIFKSSTGETCTAVGQLFDGKFGIVGLDHVFRALPLEGVDACGVPGIAGPVLAGARQFAGRTAAEARTVVNGIAGAGARSVIAYGLGAERRLPLGPQGSFVAVYQGLLGEVRPRIVVVDASGDSKSISFAASAAFETADPDGGAPWQVSGGSAIGVPHATGDENCASASQEIGPGNSGGPTNESEGAGVCGRLGSAPLFVRFHRFNPGDGEDTPNPWGNNPARTLVYGGASLRVRRLTLSGAGPPREIAIDPHGGAFLAVLDGRVDPRTLTLTATLTDGRTLHYRRSTTLFVEQTGERLDEGRVEPYRSVIHPGSIFAPLEDPIPRTVIEQLHVADPAGGAAWTLRSWQGRADPRAKFGEADHPTRFYCWQAGVISAGRLVEPHPGAAARPLSVSDGPTDEPGTHCTGAGAPSTEDLTPTVEAYPQNAAEYEPLPVRTVVTGVIEPSAVAPMLLGAGPPRPITADANHVYLMVLPGAYWASRLRVSARLPDGRMLISGVESSAPNVLPQVRAPSPDGSAPWGFTQTSLCPKAWSFSEVGRVVDGHFADILESTGQVAAGPGATSTGSTCGTKNARAQQRYEPLGGEEGGQPNAPLGITVVHSSPEGAHEPTEAEIQRRTLPGTTVIAGDAAADVTSITLTTPADVRTVQPSGPTHVFIVVYDGVFYRGTFTATSLLKSGRTVTQLIRGGPYNRYAAPEPAPGTLSSQLRSDERTLHELATQVADVLHSEGARRQKLLNGVPLAQLLKGLSGIRADVAGEHARIAFIQRHPGILPPE